jgi:hypothetical protein
MNRVIEWSVNSDCWVDNANRVHLIKLEYAKVK